MHYFFNTLIKKGFFPEFLEDQCIPTEVREFVNRLVPLKYQTGRYVTKRGRILTDQEYLTPDQVLQSDPFFNQFRNIRLRRKKDDYVSKKSEKLNVENLIEKGYKKN